MPYYLLILLLLSTNFFHIQVVGTFMSDDTCLVVYVLILIWGYIKFGKITIKKAFSSSANKYGRIYLVGVILSFIPALLYFNQSFLQSFITCRWMFALFTLPVLVAIRPTKAHFQKAIFVYTIIYLLVVSIDAVTNDFVVRTVDVLHEEKDVNAIDEGGFIHFTLGYYIICLGLFMKLQDLSETFSLKSLLVSVLFLFVIFLVQNRGTLFPCALIFIYSVLTVKDVQYKTLSRVVGCIVIIISLYYAWSSISELLNETQIQMNDGNYNRIKALAYFLTQGVHGPLSYLFGNGFLSSHIAWDEMMLLRDLGVYTSDIGLVGLWSKVGILPVYAILLLMSKGIRKNNPLYIRYTVLFQIFGMLLNLYFLSVSQVVPLCFYFYYLNKDNFQYQENV